MNNTPFSLIYICPVFREEVKYERGETTPNIEMATKLANALDVSLDYLVGNTDIALDKNILDKVVSIQKLPDEDKTCIMYSIDGLIQHAKNRQAYVSTAKG